MPQIFYKRKHAQGFQSLVIDGPNKKCADVKVQLATKLNISQDAEYEIVLSDNKSQKRYTDDDLIPKHSVIVWETQPRGILQTLVPTQEVPPVGFTPSRNRARQSLPPDPTEFLNSQRKPAQVPAVDSEADETQKIMQHSRMNVPPPDYVCYECQQKGHFKQDCPNRRTHHDLSSAVIGRVFEKRAKGIPDSHLMPAAANTEGAMVGPGGRHFVQVQDAYGIRESKLNKNRGAVRQESVIPDGWRCGVCRDLLRDAVSMKCCSTFFCASCVDDYVAANDNVCPNNECHEPVNPMVDIIVEKSLRTQILQHLGHKNANAHTNSPLYTETNRATSKSAVLSQTNDGEKSPVAPIPERPQVVKTEPNSTPVVQSVSSSSINNVSNEEPVKPIASLSSSPNKVLTVSGAPNLPPATSGNHYIQDRTCYCCQEKGHMANDCPRRNQRNMQQQQNNANIPITRFQYNRPNINPSMQYTMPTPFGMPLMSTMPVSRPTMVPGLLPPSISANPAPPQFLSNAPVSNVVRHAPPPLVPPQLQPPALHHPSGLALAGGAPPWTAMLGPNRSAQDFLKTMARSRRSSSSRSTSRSDDRRRRHRRRSSSRSSSSYERNHKRRRNHRDRSKGHHGLPRFDRHAKSPSRRTDKHKSRRSPSRSPSRDRSHKKARGALTAETSSSGMTQAEYDTRIAPWLDVLRQQNTDPAVIAEHERRYRAQIKPSSSSSLSKRMAEMFSQPSVKPPPLKKRRKSKSESDDDDSKSHRKSKKSKKPKREHKSKHKKKSKRSSSRLSDSDEGHSVPIDESGRLAFEAPSSEAKTLADVVEEAVSASNNPPKAATPEPPKPEPATVNNDALATSNGTAAVYDALLPMGTDTSVVRLESHCSQNVDNEQESVAVTKGEDEADELPSNEHGADASAADASTNGDMIGPERLDLLPRDSFVEPISTPPPKEADTGTPVKKAKKSKKAKDNDDEPSKKKKKKSKHREAKSNDAEATDKSPKKKTSKKEKSSKKDKADESDGEGEKVKKSKKKKKADKVASKEKSSDVEVNVKRFETRHVISLDDV